MDHYINPIPSLSDDIKELELQEQTSYGAKKTVYFSFIDVLGFKDAFNERIRPENDVEKKFSPVFSYFFDLMNKTNLAKLGYAGQTSDSLYYYTDGVDVIFDFIKVYSYFSLFAMSNGVFFRGGIARGGLTCKEQHQFFGDSVIKAYLLESEIAKYPVVAVDEETYKEIKKNHTDYYCYLTEEKGRYYIIPFAGFQKIKFSKAVSCSFPDLDKKKIRTNIEKNKKILNSTEKLMRSFIILRISLIIQQI